MHSRHDQLGELVSAQPGIAQLIDASAVKQVFSQCMKYDQAAWSLLFFALWHSHHILQLSCEGDIAATLTEAARFS
jgi:asparagine synthase (glutamine-hydrolysing)